MKFDTASSFGEFSFASGANFKGKNCGSGPAELHHSVRGILEKAGNELVVVKGNCRISAYVDLTIHYHGTTKLMRK